MLSQSELIDLCEISDEDYMDQRMKDIAQALSQVMARNDLVTAQVGEPIRVALKKFLAGFIIMEERCRS